MTGERPLMRSVLYTPASRVDRVRKALEAGAADVVVADLEDGTAPGDRAAARVALRELLASPPTSRGALAVRLNALGSRDYAEDRKALADVLPPLVVVPKVESAKSLREAVTGLRKARPDVRVLAMIETAKGVLGAQALAAEEGVAGIVFGSEDYAASVGATRTAEGVEVLWARSRVVASAAAAGVEAIDQVWADYRDMDGLRRDAALGVQLGFAGKQVIHPDQVPVVHAALAPSPKSVDFARRVVEASAKAKGGVAVVDGRMIDRPLVEQAKRVLRRAEAPR